MSAKCLDLFLFPLALASTDRVFIGKNLQSLYPQTRTEVVNVRWFLLFLFIMKFSHEQGANENELCYFHSYSIILSVKPVECGAPYIGYSIKLFKFNENENLQLWMGLWFGFAFSQQWKHFNPALWTAHFCFFGCQIAGQLFFSCILCFPNRSEHHFCDGILHSARIHVEKILFYVFETQILFGKLFHLTIHCKLQSNVFRLEMSSYGDWMNIEHIHHPG